MVTFNLDKCLVVCGSHLALMLKYKHVKGPSNNCSCLGSKHPMVSEKYFLKSYGVLPWIPLIL